MSSLLFDVIFASRCRGTHHKLALDALRFVRGEAAGRWCNLFLSLHEPYLEGARAPDTLFRDFRNHVFHISEGGWGGAVTSAEAWFERTLKAFQRQSWEEGVYSAGVLSHYFADPHQPLHTGQSETENVIHRGLEWSIAQSYGELQQILEQDLGGYPDFEAPDREGWLGELIRDGAFRAHALYQTTLDHYDVRRGSRDPRAGMDQELKDAMAQQIGRAVVGFSRVLEIIFEEAEVLPPEMDISIQGFLATLNVPLYWFVRQLSETREWWGVSAARDEFLRSGKILQNLTEDDREIRKLHAQEVLQIPLARLDAEPVGETGTLYGEGAPPRAHSNRPLTAKPKLRATTPEDEVRPRTIGKPKTAPPEPARPAKPAVAAPPTVQPPVQRPAVPDVRPAVVAEARASTPTVAVSPPPQKVPAPQPVQPPTIPARTTIPTSNPKFYLDLDSPVADAPSIGPKTAERLAVLNVSTVLDLLDLKPETAAAKLQSRFITAEVLRDWQTQAELVLSIPGLRGHDAQILVACGIREASHLNGLDPQALATRVDAFCSSPAGERVLRNGSRPTLEEITGWIRHAQSSRTARAA